MLSASSFASAEPHRGQGVCDECSGPSWAIALAALQEASGRELASELIRATQFHLVQGRAEAFAVETITGSAGTAIPLSISLPPLVAEAGGAKPIRRFLMLKGIPDSLTLSSGFRTRNAWIVAGTDARGLRMNVPPDYRGSFSVEVLLHRGEADTPERRTIAVKISPPVPVAALPRVPADQEAPPAPPPREDRGAPVEELALLAQGEMHLRNGNIIFARAVFEELAARGSARGAFAVAQTYDPAVLEQIGTVGLQGDVEQAKHWYRKAAELGNIPSLDILSSLRKERPQQ